MSVSLKKRTDQDVLVLLATYNGEEYILAQIESILGQGYPHVQLLIRDDGSTDNTVKIVEDYIRKQAISDIQIVENTTSLKGHKHNFSVLSNLALESDFSYFCFSDQDDVWHENKVAVQYQTLSQLESKHNNSTPILVHSDLMVVDQNLELLSSSFFTYQGLPDAHSHDFPTFCYQNVVTGCVSFFNRALLTIAAPMPKDVVVHDWWFALCAKAYGQLEFIDKPLINYRQHAHNAIGATNIANQRKYMSRYFIRTLCRFPRNLSNAISQSSALYEILSVRNKSHSISADSLILLELFSQAKQQSLIKRVKSLHLVFNDKRSLGERIYLYFVFIIVGWIK